MGTRAKRGASRSRVLGPLLFLAVSVSAAPSQERAREVVRVALEPAGEGVVGVVEADGTFEHRLYVMDEARKLVVDVLDVRSSFGRELESLEHPLLESVRCDQLSMTAYDPQARGRSFARVTFSLAEPVRHSLRASTGRLELAIHPVGSVESTLEAIAAVEGRNLNGDQAPASLPQTDHAAPDESAGFIEPADVSPDVFFGPAARGPSEYVLGPDDVVEVRVFELEQLNRTVRVEADGSILLPLIGPVRISGLTAPQAAAAVADELRGDFVDDPQVTVLVTDYQSRRVSLLGAVTRPGTYPLIGQRALLELLASAEGLSPGAGSSLFVFRKLPDGRNARLSVPLQELLVLGEPKWNIWLQPGDVVSVPPENAISVSVVGSVGKPGVYKLPAGRGATLLRALALAGGLQPRASKNVQIKRSSPTGEEQNLKVDVGDIMSGERADFVLQEGDVVIVNQSFF